MSGLLADPDLRRVWDALPEARVVGGAVRDALLGRAVADIDLAIPRPPAEIVAALERANLRAIATGLDHGTVTALSGGRGFEVTTLRRDVATDGRHAVVAFTDDWAKDAARRDLTFNAMSLDRAGTVSDFFGGRADLVAGRVRFVGDPARRIAEDYLRVLRYFRFLARYGREEPDPAILGALRDGVPGLARLSAERVWSELKRILAAPEPSDALTLMERLGVLAAVLPEARHPGRVACLARAGAPSDPLLRLAALVDHGDVAGLVARLRLSGAEAARLAALTAPVPALSPSADAAELRRALATMPADVLRDRSWLQGAPDTLRARLATMPAAVFPVQGRDLVARGVPPGPALGASLRALHSAWLAGGCVDDKESLLAQLPGRATT